LSDPSGFSTDPVQLLLGFVLTGGLVAGSYEWLRYFFNKRRENSFEMAKRKMDHITQAIPRYAQVSGYYALLNYEIQKRTPDWTMCFYIMCRILHINQTIYTAGGLMLDNLEAEKVLTALNGGLKQSLRDVFGYFKVDKMTSFGAKHSSFDTFHDDLFTQKWPHLYSEINAIFNEVTVWLSDTSVNKNILGNRRRSVIQNGIWCAHLLVMELNHVFNLWYGETGVLDRKVFEKIIPVFEDLELQDDTNTQKLNEYLLENWPVYLKRVQNIGERSLIMTFKESLALIGLFVSMAVTIIILILV
jgi:hypothetical protein